MFTIDGAGSDIWGTADQFQFVYQQISGDVDVTARVDSFNAPSVWAKAGVMIRASLNGNSAQGSALMTAARGVQYQGRASTGASSTMPTASRSAQAPVWLRVSRRGTTVTGYYSTNGTSWTSLGSSTVALGTSAYVGLVTSSNNTGTRATARISNATVSRLGLPSGQASMDLGGSRPTGSATYTSGTYTVRAGGADIWDAADQFHFVYQPITGNADVVVRVASITNTNQWAKAGVMIRESLTAESRHAMVVTSISKGYAFQRRQETGEYSVHTAGGSGTAPGWVRLVRTGDRFQAYRSTNGTSWTSIGTDTIPMQDTVYVGLAATSHNTSALTTATFDNFRLTASSGGNQSPAVSITSPANGATVNVGAAVNIAATATDPEGRMASVDFYVGSTQLVRDTSSPYSATWTPSSAGTYSLTAVAHDQDGGSTTSSAISVTVNSASNQAPTVSLTSPTAGATFTAPASITLAANASDPEGQIARVEFFRGSTRIATDTSAPYSYNWTNVAAGTYSITAVAYDAQGASRTSAAVSVTVGGATTTPPRYVVFAASSDHSANVTNYVLRVFASTANPATATPIATSDLGKPAPATNGDITVDRLSFFTALAAGNYIATVTAVGPGGQTQSASVAFTR